MIQSARTSFVVAFALLAVIAMRGDAAACPFCSAPSLTLSEQMSQSDAIVLVQWVSAEKAKDQKPGKTTYEVVQVVKVPPAKKDDQKSLQKGDHIELVRYRAAKKGDLFLLTGSKGTEIEWGSPLEVTETSFNYITQTPSPEAPPEERLAYFLKFLEYPDDLVANDAYGEFANAPYKDIRRVADQLPREKVRSWVTGNDTPVTRLGLYGLLLGLCGNAEDAVMMEQKINDETEDFRLGIDGVIFGYLLLSGEKGLKVIEDSKLRNEDIPFSETYAAMQALRQLWTYGDGSISKDRMRAAMRILLDRAELADLVIADLARWKDWSVQDRLMSLYGAEAYNIPSIKRAIVRYLLVCSRDVPGKDKKTTPVAKTVVVGSGDATGSDNGKAAPVKKPQVVLPPHVKTAKKRLEELREKDPKTVRDAERFFFP